MDEVLTTLHEQRRLMIAERAAMTADIDQAIHRLSLMIDEYREKTGAWYLLRYWRYHQACVSKANTMAEALEEGEDMADACEGVPVDVVGPNGEYFIWPSQKSVFTRAELDEQFKKAMGDA